MSAIVLGDHLILHGAICLLIGLLCGVPLGSTINKDAHTESIHGWRVAHLGLSIGGFLLFSIAAVLPRISGGPILDGLAAWGFVLSTYGFIIALPIGASNRNRGLQASEGLGQLVYAGNLVGAGGSLVGAVALLILAIAGVFGR